MTQPDTAMPDVIYVIDAGIMGGKYQTYHSGRNETEYHLSTPDTIQLTKADFQAMVDDIKLIRATAGDIQTGVFQGTKIRCNIGVPVSRACDRIEAIAAKYTKGE